MTDTDLQSLAADVERDIQGYNSAFIRANLEANPSLMRPWMRLPVSIFGNGSVAMLETPEDAEPFAMPEDICTPAMLSRIAPGARHLQTFVSSTSAAIIGGALLLAIKQMASAQLDTADSTLKSAQLLEKMLRTLDTMKPRPEQAQAQAQGAPAGDRNRVIKTYRGKAICREAVGVSVDETPFGNVLAAEKWIDQQARANP